MREAVGYPDRRIDRITNPRFDGNAGNILFLPYGEHLGEGHERSENADHVDGTIEPALPWYRMRVRRKLLRSLFAQMDVMLGVGCFHDPTFRVAVPDGCIPRAPLRTLLW